MKSKIMIKGMQYKNTKIGFIPGNWSIVRLSEIADTYSGGTPSRKVKEYWNGNIPWLKSGELNDSFVQKASEKITEAGYRNSSAKFVENGTLLIAMYGATAGKVALVRSKLSINQAICAIKFYKNICPEFYFYYFIKIRNKLLANRFGGAQPNLNQQIIKNLLIPLPPLPEQKAIAYVLSTIQEAKEKTEKVIQAAKELKKSLMKHLFTYGPVSLDEAKKVKLKETEIGLVNELWEIKHLGSIGEFQYGYTETASKKKVGPKFVRITDIDLDSGQIRWEHVPFCKITDENHSKYELFEGDILIARIGATTGKTCIIKNPPECVFASYLIRFKVDRTKVDPFFVYYFTISDMYWRQIGKTKDGKLKKGISSSQLKNFLIPIPPVVTQQKIVSILLAVDKEIESEENKKKALEELFKSMLHNLMSAKIRVNNISRTDSD